MFLHVLSQHLDSLISIKPYFKEVSRRLRPNGIKKLLGNGSGLHSLNMHHIDPDLIYESLLDLIKEACPINQSGTSDVIADTDEGLDFSLLSPSVACFMISSILHHIFHKDTDSVVHLTQHNLAFLELLESYYKSQRDVKKELNTLRTADQSYPDNGLAEFLEEEDLECLLEIWTDFQTKQDLVLRARASNILNPPPSVSDKNIDDASNTSVINGATFSSSLDVANENCEREAISNAASEDKRETIDNDQETNPLKALSDEDVTLFLIDRLEETQQQFKILLKIVRTTDRETLWQHVLESEESVRLQTGDAILESGGIRSVGGVFLRAWKRKSREGLVERKIAVANACREVMEASNRVSSHSNSTNTGAIKAAIQATYAFGSEAIYAGAAPPGPPPFWKHEGNWVKLRPYQSRCIADVWRPTINNDSLVINAPTGSGKSFLMMELLGRMMQLKQSQARGGAKQVLITPTVPLCDQFTILLRTNTSLIKAFAPAIVVSNGASPLSVNTWLELMHSKAHVIIVGTAQSLLNIVQTLSTRGKNAYEAQVAILGKGKKRNIASGFDLSSSSSTSTSPLPPSSSCTNASLDTNAIFVDPALLNPLSVLDAIFLDEAHHCRKDSPYAVFMKYFKPHFLTRVYGFSASIASGITLTKIEDSTQDILHKLNNARFYAIVPTDSNGLNDTVSDSQPGSSGADHTNDGRVNDSDDSYNNSKKKTCTENSDLNLSECLAMVNERVELLSLRSRDVQFTGALIVAIWDILLAVVSEMLIIRRRLKLPSSHPDSLAHISKAEEEDYSSCGEDTKGANTLGTADEYLEEITEAIRRAPMKLLATIARAHEYLSPNESINLLCADRVTVEKEIQEAKMRADEDARDNNIDISISACRSRLQWLLQREERSEDQSGNTGNGDFGNLENPANQGISQNDVEDSNQFSNPPFKNQNQRVFNTLERLGIASLPWQKEILTHIDTLLTSAIRVGTGTKSSDLLILSGLARATLRSFEIIGIVGYESALMFLARRFAWSLVSSAQVRLMITELTPFTFHDEMDEICKKKEKKTITRSETNGVFLPNVSPSSRLLKSMTHSSTSSAVPPSDSSAGASSETRTSDQEVATSLPKEPLYVSRPSTRLLQVMETLLSSKASSLSLFLDDDAIAKEVFVSATTSILKDRKGAVNQASNPSENRSTQVPLSSHYDGIPLEPFPKLGALRQILRARLKKPEARQDFHGIIFASRRQAVFAVTDFLRSDPCLQDVEILEFVGHSSKSDNTSNSAYSGPIRERWDYGMGGHEQYDVIRLFKMAGRKILVSTNAAEEGIDVPSCNLVIRFTPASTGIQRIQSRGRARTRASEFITLLQASTSDEMWHHNGQLEERELEKYIRRNLRCAAAEKEGWMEEGKTLSPWQDEDDLVKEGREANEPREEGRNEMEGQETKMFDMRVRFADEVFDLMDDD
eukprot:CAMPEP_0175079408 /NCGR_PEP_ID=MMETSP0052_2-20121109/24804_1 /TAXON_ID=51329 ORGANISM="Polytomella parva, Strain SAG 63-3" /NCGR_SAMPLE_ID=MMETSP0052_2 /ASSEMBLY_ACC=CAM_ASM_000194 /LENGTH=1442 /DNA_ID=CAMNT_0016349731 /DNA_START=114 /DNA_END=4442 /DNA_ORIENTATION=-